MTDHGTPLQRLARPAAVSSHRAAPGSPALWWWGREFPGTEDQVSRVRHWVKDLLPACDALDLVLLLTSEVCTNAIKHTCSGLPGGRFTVDVEWTLEKTRVVIGDQGSDTVPVTNPQADAAAENGRGLVLVDSLASWWGTVRLPGGRLVWADFPWRAAGGPQLDPPGGWEAGARDIALLRDVFPRTTIWWGHQTGAWHAALPGAVGADGVVSAPTRGTLGLALADAYPRPGGTPPPADAPRLAAVPPLHAP